MDLKFTFGGTAPGQHDHGAAPSGIPLPFSTAPASTSSVLELRVRRADGELVGEVLSGDGVVYTSSSVGIGDDGSAALARAARSAAARAIAGLEGPLAEAVTSVVLDLGAAGAGVLAELGIAAGAVDESLQRRIGIAAGTPVSLV